MKSFLKNIIFLFGLCFNLLSSTPSLPKNAYYHDPLPCVMNYLLRLKTLRQTPPVLWHQCELKKFLYKEFLREKKVCLVGNNKRFAFIDEKYIPDMLTKMFSYNLKITEEERIIWVEYSQEQSERLLEGVREDEEELSSEKFEEESFFQIIYFRNGKSCNYLIEA